MGDFLKITHIWVTMIVGLDCGLYPMTIPPETEQLFREQAALAVQAFRRELGVFPTSNAFMNAFDQVLLPSMRQHFTDLAKTEFERIGREHVRSIVLSAFDKFMESK